VLGGIVCGKSSLRSFGLEIEEEDYEVGGTEFAMGAATGEAEGLDPRSIEEARGRADWLQMGLQD
jgi:hypothetical protein